MHKLLLSVTLIFFSVLTANAVTPSAKLTGTPLGVGNYFDPSTNSCSTASSLVNTAFDNNITTTFSTCNSDGGWVGLDLGDTTVITQIKYCPAAGSSIKMRLGVFEGANKPDFGDAIPLFLIPTSPIQNTFALQNINCSKGFRYVRFVGPSGSNCLLSEIEFYGYKSIGDNSILPQTTNLPSVIIHTKDAVNIVDKENYIKGIISVVSTNGTILFTDSLEIKGRGNASWNFPKKPYRIKLYNKTNLLGMPAKEKSWTLINNYGDKTLMRNLLANDLSKRLEIPYTPAGKSVDVFLNGEYKGCYQLCDQIEVATGRVGVEKMAITTTTLPDLSGGYLLEMDAYASGEVSWFTSANNQVPVTIKYPKDDEMIPAQSSYIKSHFEKMETAVASSNYTNPTTGYRQYIDVPTFIRHFLVGEFTGNTDTYWSTYMYKKKNIDKFYFGPVWDFDIAYENDYRTYPINDNPEWIYASTGSAANGVRNIVNKIFTDPSFSLELKDTYAHYRSTGVITSNALTQVVTDYALELDQSQKLNFLRWNIINTAVHMNPKTYGSYGGEVNNIKNYIQQRIIWMDKKLGYVASGISNNAYPEIYCWSASNTLHIKGLLESSTIEIVDLSGRTIVQSKAEYEYSTILNNGVYIIKVSDMNGATSIFKCVIK